MLPTIIRFGLSFWSSDVGSTDYHRWSSSMVSDWNMLPIFTESILRTSKEASNIVSMVIGRVEVSVIPNFGWQVHLSFGLFNKSMFILVSLKSSIVFGKKGSQGFAGFQPSRSIEGHKVIEGFLKYAMWNYGDFFVLFFFCN